MGKTANQAITNKIVSRTSDLSVRKRHGRAVNAVADYLRSHLRVPNVYIEASVSGSSKVDVLAADAAGSGDIHAAEVKVLTGPPTSTAIGTYIEQIKSLPAHYKYVALPRNATSVNFGIHLFSTDGIGRVGLFFISESEDLAPTVELAIKPERFRMNSAELSRIERFLSRAKPDMYVRL
jgi:hypothetical protein